MGSKLNYRKRIAGVKSSFQNQLRLFQNFSFWNSFSGFNGKTGLLAGFSRSLSKTNRVLEQAQLF
jgi:hypothetical protein